MKDKGNTSRLLVLDDENAVATTICMMAETAGYETDHTDDPDVFIEKILSWRPTFVTVDLRLSLSDGVEVLHRLAEIDCQATIIIISGLGKRILDSSARAAIESGLSVAGVLPKPVSRADLLAVLAAHVESPFSRNQPVADQQQSIATSERLADALLAREFVVHFQPKVSCATGELVGFECLVRWPQKDGTTLPPDLFIGLAEQTGMINELSRQICECALSNLPGFAKKPALKYALNISPINLDDSTFSSWLSGKCLEYGITPSQVILELTEASSMSNAVAGLEKLTQFRIQGFHLSIDDFGVGYSSLIQLARLPFSELKIDQMFVKSLSTSEESRKIVTTLVALGHSLGLNTVAEGVEDAAAFEILRDIGCDEAQGYFIARPMDFVSAEAWNGFV